MTPTEFKQAREALGLNKIEMGRALGNEQDGGYSERTVSSWEAGERGIPPAVAKLVRIMLRAK